MKKEIIEIKDTKISLYSENSNDYISLTDIAKYKGDRPDMIIQNWIRTYNTITYLGLWEKINNPNFNPFNYEGVKNESKENAFVMTAKKWIETTNAIGIVSKPGRYGGTYAHKDIAFKFASWISVEFELFLIKEFQRLKEQELKNKSVAWSVRRELTKINYKLQTDSIKNFLIPSLEDFKKKYIYSDEADLLNIIIFGQTAKQFKEKHLDKKGNLRDYASIEQLLLLANLENLNGEFIKQGLDKEQRYKRLVEITKRQYKILFENSLRKI